MLDIDKLILKTIFGSRVEVSAIKPKSSKLVYTFDYISNPDGGIRWIWPSNSKKPLFLKFYAASTKRARLVFLFLSFLFYLPWLRRFYIKKLYLSSPSKLFLKEQLDHEESNYAVFTGTVGPNRKIVVFQKNNNQSSFLKIPFGETSSKSLLNELNRSEAFTDWSSQILTPQLSMKNGVLKSSDLKVSGLRKKELSFESQMILLDVLDKTIIKRRAGLSQVEFIAIDPKKRILIELKEAIASVSKKHFSKDIYFSLNHGDFTPWNCSQEGKVLKLYDLEFCSNGLPIYYDLFHFWTQQLLMCTKMTNSQIIMQLSKRWKKSVFNSHAQNLGLSFKDTFLSYVYFVAQHYCVVYNNQAVIHHQGQRLILFLTEVLNSSLEAVTNNLRSYHIDKIATQLKTIDHAIVKEFGLLADIKEKNSDIDVVMRYKDVKEFISNLSLYGVVKKKVVSKKCMKVIQLFFEDNTFLSIDVILEFKQRWHHYLEANQVLATALKKADGLSYASNKINVEYIILFYALNGAQVPVKYKRAIQTLDVSEIQVLHTYFKSKYKLNFQIFINAQCKIDGVIIEKLKKYSLRISANKSLSSYYNYFKDFIIDLNFGCSRVITFSGVDGAGKTTIINATKKIIEKKYRQKVVVLRHRPSLFPILSAYVYGKAEASKRSAERLPRQGDNKSTFTSYLRFTYYLIDYLLGQFYIFVRYTMLNYVVIYDRYYFDFILDGKRSNINLDQKIPKFFLKLIMKPELNFFLYARPEVILKRKQELSFDVISSLNKSYKGLFAELASKHKQSFIAIENLDLNKTLGLINTNFVTKM